VSVLIRFSTCGYVNALRLFDIGLGQIGTTREAEVPREIGPERWRHWHYRLLVDQAWARFGIGAYAGSEQDLKDAVALETTTPAAYLPAIAGSSTARRVGQHIGPIGSCRDGLPPR
jgi:hypothetical protein